MRRRKPIKESCKKQRRRVFRMDEIERDLAAYARSKDRILLSVDEAIGILERLAWLDGQREKRRA